MPGVTLIAADIDAGRSVEAGIWSPKHSKSTVGSGADRDIQNHLRVEDAFLLRPGLPSVIADIEPEMRSKIYDVWAAAKGDTVEMRLRIGEGAARHSRSAIIHTIIEHLPDNHDGYNQKHKQQRLAWAPVLATRPWMQFGRRGR